MQSSPRRPGCKRLYCCKDARRLLPDAAAALLGRAAAHSALDYKLPLHRAQSAKHNADSPGLLQMFYELGGPTLLGGSGKPRRARNVLELRQWKVCGINM